MKRSVLIVMAVHALAIVAAPGAGSASLSQGSVVELASTLRDAALERDQLAWDLLESLTTEVGPRLAGTEGEERARQWAVARLTQLGFSNIRVEAFDTDVWLRGEERAHIISPFAQPLAVTALGNSGATPPQGVEAEVLGFASLEALESAPDHLVRGRIVFISHALMASHEVSGYLQFGAVRRLGPSIASRKGAAAIVIRSIGTDYHRNPHTGVQNWAEGTMPIPAGALSIPDSEQLQRILLRASRAGRSVRMRLTLTPRSVGARVSGNVVAEIPGSDPSAEAVLIGGHLDSWDLGTGAIDNGAGIAIIIAAAHRIMQAGRPRRTIRLVLFGAEEGGGIGSRHYFARHRNDNVGLVAESDSGDGRVWRVVFNLAPENTNIADRVAALLAPLGVVRGNGRATTATDLRPWVSAGRAAIDLNQDLTRYFDYHHTADDTLDKVDQAQLRQAVAAWTVMLACVADAPGTLSPIAQAQ